VLLLPHGELAHLLETYGYGAISGLVALEAVGIPLPGETALVSAAILAGTNHVLNIWFVIAAATVGAIVGDNIGFWLGREFGYRLLVRYGRYIRVTMLRIKIGQYLFLRYGGWVVFFGRFVPILRVLGAFLAGTNRLDWPRFFSFDAAGATVWATIYGVGAYWLGHEIRYLAKPVGIGLGVLALIGLVGLTLLLRRHEAELGKRVEAASPGPLQPIRR
jgi:membrane protein DedA with SNARE-associated domain